MVRVRLELPRHFPFRTEVRVRITDVNYGGHLGNDALLSLIHEARTRFLASRGLAELGGEGQGLIMVDAVVVYRAEAFHGDRLSIAVAVQDLRRSGFDLLYRVRRAAGETEVARVKTGQAFFDYRLKKIVALPEPYRRGLDPA